MKSGTQSFLAAILLATPLAALSADITYYVDESVSSGSVVGTIETDGTIGVLNSTDVLAWDLTLRAPNLDGGTGQVLTQFNGAFSDGGGFGATATHLVFNYGGTSGQYFIFQGGSDSDYWCGADIGGISCNGETDPAETIGFSKVGGRNAQVLSEAGVGLKSIASAVPAPTTVAMLSCGLLALGLVTMRKRHRSPAAAVEMANSFGSESQLRIA